MCGIAGSIGKTRAVKNILPMLRRMEYRGYDSAGIATISGGEIICLKDVGHLSEALPEHKVNGMEGYVGIGHTRWATHGEVTAMNSHPHSDCTGKILVIHNGVVENYLEIKESLPNHKMKSQTDTEVVAHLVEFYCQLGHDIESAVAVACRDLVGTFALVVMHSDYPDKLVVARRGSPVLLGKGEDTLLVASDPLAFQGIAKEYIECPDDSVVVLSEVMKKVADTHGGRMQMLLTCDRRMDDIEESGKGNYAHYMLKEIMEQPRIFKRAIRQDKYKLYTVAMEILKAHSVILTGCGTSRYACIVGRYLMSSLGNKMAEVIVGSELHYMMPAINSNTVIVALSQSGETADILQGIRLAKEKGAKIISVVNRPYSSLERLSDLVMFMAAGNEIGVAATKSFTAQLAVLYLIAYTMANKYDEGVEILEGVPLYIKELLGVRREVKRVAERIKDSEHIYYIGKGLNFAIAGECSLKMKEITYIHAESMAGGELKHGTLSLITDRVPIVGICPDDGTYNEVVTNLSEAKARRGLIIGVSDKNNAVFDEWLRIPSVNPLYYPVMTSIVGQLLAYYAAVARGLDADKPRNLAKSVTVL